MRENNRYNSRMLDRRLPPAEISALRRRRRRGDRIARPIDRPFESVDADFDDAPLDDLRRQAGTGRIEVADL